MRDVSERANEWSGRMSATVGMTDSTSSSMNSRTSDLSRNIIRGHSHGRRASDGSGLVSDTDRTLIDTSMASICGGVNGPCAKIFIIRFVAINFVRKNLRRQNIYDPVSHKNVSTEKIFVVNVFIPSLKYLSQDFICKQIHEHVYK